ncbi:radical SAM protein [Bacillus canaveralius]|uniref:radical SAM protein n=1 Tax=Bacillus canaveralius TaxID=1403243 RepID=UPI000F79FD21|nr:radical SAM protein [Bacillus canaveralius]RSK54652.1 radical SAM protein [Bacillus canaveralius]
MLRKITKDNLGTVKNKSFLKYAQIYTNIETETIKAIESFGLPLQQREFNKDRGKKLTQLRAAGAILRNNDKSIATGRISSACEACQTGEGSYTSFISLKCHRNCYFCFNPNQEDYTFYTDRQKDINKELLELLENGVELKHLALTGGEPLLFKEEAIAFFELANEKTPQTYTRLYTAGDLLDVGTFERLKQANLSEIRFSIKMEDSVQKRKHILGKIAMAKEYIPYVLVEMPVIPGTLEEMKTLILQLEEIGIYGINLLEFCFPLGNAQAFKDRGFILKNPPYEVYYNYWYAGGLAVAESEEMCLELLEFSLKEKLNLSVHYCSLENKHTGQIYQQNFDHKPLDESYLFSNQDYFLKTAKVFGKDKRKVLPALAQRKIFHIENSEHDFVQFPIEAIERVGKINIEIAISSNVVEHVDGEAVIREVSVEWTTPGLFQLDDIVGPVEQGGEIR